MKSIYPILVLFLSIGWKYSFGSDDGDRLGLNSLRITWGRDPFSGNFFVKQPLTTKEAKKAGFKRIPEKCEGKFLGYRYIQNNDVSLILIYDSDGVIAGIQMGVPISIVTEYYDFTRQKMFNRDRINGIDVYVLTAYFIDPRRICRSKKNPYRKEDCKANGLWLQNGTHPIHDSFLSSIKETEITSTKWVQGQCFPTMGMHYWYDNRLDLDCSVFFPAFLMYDKGQLAAFGWGVAGYYDNSNHTEHPPLSVLNLFLKPVPRCIPQLFNQTGGFTSMHIFFHPEPWTISC